MPAAYVISPIVEHFPIDSDTGLPGTESYKCPKVETFVDGSGLPLYVHTSKIYPERGMGWCFSYVCTRGAADWSVIDADPDCVRLFDETIPDEPDGRKPSRESADGFLNARPNASDLAALRGRLARFGASHADLSPNNSRSDWVTRMGIAASAGMDIDFDPRGWRTWSKS